MKGFNNLFVILTTIFLLVFSNTIFSQVHTYTNVRISGDQEIPATGSSGTGTLNGTYDETTMELIFTVNFSGLSGTTTASHFHGPALPDSNTGIQIPISGFPTGVMSGSITDTVTLNATQEAQLLTGLWYINIHTTAFGGGEIRGQIFESGGIHYFTHLSLSGNQENPSTGSSGTGTFTGRYNEVTDEFIFTVDFSGLMGTTTASHFHGPAVADSNAGIQIPLTGFPTGVTSGSFSDTVTLNETQEADLLAEKWYINIHTSAFGGGEIRGQLYETKPLPVELTSFTASVNSNNVLLKWTTATELNNLGFEIHRSNNKQDWNSLGFINGKGTSSEISNYAFEDKNLSSGRYYYRLKQVDNNGTFEYSSIVEVAVGNIPAGFVLEQNYPNPFNPSTVIKFGFDKVTKASLKIYDELGNEVATLFSGPAEGGRIYELTFNASGLSSGVYYYQLSGDNKTEIKKMMLLK
jgi:CHRD domain/Secretion system C-terminal sorting domain